MPCGFESFMCTAFARRPGARRPKAKRFKGSKAAKRATRRAA